MNEIVSELGLLPFVSALALSTTMPPELILLPAFPVTAEAEAERQGDSAEAALLRRALEAEQMTVRRVHPDR